MIAANTDARRPKTLAELMNSAQDSPPMIVEDILPPGLLLLVASPKSGKTRLMLQLSEAIVHGDVALGRFATRRSAVLYYALEDRAQRIGRAAQSMNLRPSDDLFVLDSLPPINAEGCDQLRHDIGLAPNVRLVVIDVLNRVMPKAEGGRSAYHDEAVALMPLQQLAAELEIAIVVVHHTNKNPDPSNPLLSINGTQALGGTADNLWFLSRGKDGANGELRVMGRDIRDIAVPLEFSPIDGRWMITEPDEQQLAVRLDLSTRAQVRKTILDAVSATTTSRKQLMKALQERLGDTATQSYLERAMDDSVKELVDAGKLVKERLGRETLYRAAESA